MLIGLAGIAVSASATPVHLRCEYRQNPLGIDAPEPHLSWQSDSSERNWKQAAYQVLVASSVDLLHAGRPDLWDSGKTESDESVGIAYKGPSLRVAQAILLGSSRLGCCRPYFESTEEAWWETGLLHPSDWKASWIYWKNPEDQADRAGMRWIWLARGRCACCAAEKGCEFSRFVQALRKAENGRFEPRCSRGLHRQS